MLFFSRKSRAKKKTASKRTDSRPIRGEFDISPDKRGYDPYDTLPGLPRDEFGMRRQEDGKWSF